MRHLARALALALLVFLWPAALAGAEPYVVMAYNVENWLTTDRFVNGERVASAPKPENEKAAVINTIKRHRPDILGVVEMGTRDDLEDLRTRLQAAGLDYPHAEWVQGLDTTRHVALLSRFPIVARNSRGRVPFELNGRAQGIQRGILDVTVEISPGHHVRLVGLHLKSRRKVPEFDESALRALEAWHVREHLTAILTENPHARLLVFGDLNDTKNEYPVQHLMGPRTGPLSMRDILLADRRGERWTHYWRTADEYGRIDFLLASETLRREVDSARSGIDEDPSWNEASDHRALFATFVPAQP